MPIIQSSGTGKFRLVDELRKEALAISFTLRDNGETGYPPGDTEVTKYLKAGAHDEELVKHARVIALFGASFTYGMSSYLSRVIGADHATD